VQVFVVALDKPVHALSSRTSATCPFERCSTYKHSDGLYFRFLVVSCQKSPQEAASVTTKMSSHCSQRTVVRWLTIISRGFRGSNFHRPHQGIDRGFRLTVVAVIPRVWRLGRHVCRERAYGSCQRPCSEATCIISRPVESASRGRLSQQNEMCVALLGCPNRSPPPQVILVGGQSDSHLVAGTFSLYDRDALVSNPRQPNSQSCFSPDENKLPAATCKTTLV
jgi:hypothetical protein